MIGKEAQLSCRREKRSMSLKKKYLKVQRWEWGKIKEFRPTKVDIQLSEAKIPIAPEEVSKLKEHFGKEQL